MSAVSGVKRLVKAVFQLPPIKWYRARKYLRKFLTARGWQGLHYGIYDSFQQARSAVPADVTGWQPDDNGWYISQYQKVEIIDYPILFWLQRLIKPGCLLFDFGGHVGVSYRKYAPYLDYPEDFRWIVGEQAVMVKRGEEMLDRVADRHLSFVTDFKLAEAATIFHSAGCIQYVERPLVDLLAELDHLPQHLILSKVPLYQQPTKVTLQNTGYSITPNWLFNQDRFIEGICQLGFELVDLWPCPGRMNHIPFFQAYDVRTMSGLYFRRKR